MTTSDGEKRRFQDGDVLLVEDTSGAASPCPTTFTYRTEASLPRRCCGGVMKRLTQGPSFRSRPQVACRGREAQEVNPREAEVKF